MAVSFLIRTYFFLTTQPGRITREGSVLRDLGVHGHELQGSHRWKCSGAEGVPTVTVLPDTVDYDANYRHEICTDQKQQQQLL